MRLLISAAFLLSVGIFILAPRPASAAGEITFFPPSNMGAGGCNDNTTLAFNGSNPVYCKETTPLPPTCVGDNKALQFDGSSWTCATVASAAPDPAAAPPPATMAYTLDYITPWNNHFVCSGGTCHSNGGVAQMVVSDSTGSVTLQTPDPNGGVITNTFVSNGNYCGHNTNGSSSYATYGNVLYVTSYNPLVTAGSAGVASEVVTSLSSVQQKAALSGCVIH